MDNARAAALRDSRFPFLKAEEVPDVHIEISVLSLPEPLSFNTSQELLQCLKPHQDGVILKLGLRQATFLPQVWTQLPRKESFLAELSLKAGGPADLWKKPGAEVQVYRVEAFGEGG
jgi:AmmeMemoRadiSam system protein A